MTTIHDIIAAGRPNIRPDGRSKVIPTPNFRPAPAPAVDEEALTPLDRHIRRAVLAAPRAMEQFRADLAENADLRAAAKAKLAALTDAVTLKSWIDARSKQILVTALA